MSPILTSVFAGATGAAAMHFLMTRSSPTSSRGGERSRLLPLAIRGMFCIATICMLSAFITARSSEPTEARKLTSKRVTHYKPAGSTAPYSPIVRVESGPMLYTAGILPLDPTTHELVPGGIKEQTKAVMENLGKLLAERGSNWDDVIEVEVLLDDLDNWGDFTKAYLPFFNPQKLPARIVMGLGKLPFDAKVQIKLKAAARE
ncbi:MAG: RidA family protein [Verrucomicrobia bacterium]|nr:RidA family protein [Verrucomicrobiota bacterium]